MTTEAGESEREFDHAEQAEARDLRGPPQAPTNIRRRARGWTRRRMENFTSVPDALARQELLRGEKQDDKRRYFTRFAAPAHALEIRFDPPLPRHSRGPAPWDVVPDIIYSCQPIREGDSFDLTISHKTKTVSTSLGAVHPMTKSRPVYNLATNEHGDLETVVQFDTIASGPDWEFLPGAGGDGRSILFAGYNTYWCLFKGVGPGGLDAH